MPYPGLPSAARAVFKASTHILSPTILYDQSPITTVDIRIWFAHFEKYDNLPR
jgi:hypothetical protein